jgi:hypothetical protein
VKPILVAIASLLLLAACQKPASEPISDVAAPQEMLRAPPAAAKPASDAANAPEGSDQAVQVTAPMLAYDYTYGIAAAPGGVRELKTRHETACATAGPAMCQIVSSEVDEQGADNVSAKLVVRAAPPWLKTFRDGIAAETRKVGGRLTKTAVESEDLSHQIVDTQAALRAKLTLRDRLQAILQSRPGKVADLLMAERELARVQGEIDSAQSELAMMQRRVATAELTIEYHSEGVLAPQGVLAPLRNAVSDFLGLVVGAVAVMIRVVAVVLPWALILAGLWWLLRKRLPKFRPGRSDAGTPPKA